MTDTPTAKPPPPESSIRFRAFRKAMRLTQEGLAVRAGIDRVKVCKVESGLDKASTVTTRNALALGLGCTAAELDDVMSGRVEVVVMAKRVKRRAGAAAGEGVASK